MREKKKEKWRGDGGGRRRMFQLIQLEACVSTALRRNIKTKISKVQFELSKKKTQQKTVYFSLPVVGVILGHQIAQT